MIHRIEPLSFKDPVTPTTLAIEKDISIIIARLLFLFALVKHTSSLEVG